MRKRGTEGIHDNKANGIGEKEISRDKKENRKGESAHSK